MNRIQLYNDALNALHALNQGKSISKGTYSKDVEEQLRQCGAFCDSVGFNATTKTRSVEDSHYFENLIDEEKRNKHSIRNDNIRTITSVIAIVLSLIAIVISIISLNISMS